MKLSLEKRYIVAVMSLFAGLAVSSYALVFEGDRWAYITTPLLFLAILAQLLAMKKK